MQFSMRLFVVFAGVIAARDSVTPVQKVTQMLTGMLEKGKKEMHDEQVQFATYKQFCEDTETTVTKQITDATEKIEMLNADIQKYQTESEDLATEIQDLHNTAATAAADKKAGTKARELARTEYEAVHKDYTETVDAITKAVAVLKKQAYDRAQAPEATAASAALLQNVINLDKVPQASKKKLEAFLEKDDQTPPEAYGYEFQSHSVIDMLEKLKEKFIDERSELEKTELNQRHAYDMEQQDLQATITTSENAITAKSQEKSADLQLVATRQGDLTDTTATMQDDTKYKEELTSTCTQKSNDFTERQKLRADEIVAIEKAIEILSSDGVKGAAERNLPSMLQTSKNFKGLATSLAQLRAGNDKNPSNQMRMAAYLNDQAQKTGNNMLAMIAVRATEDPFSKVKTMIRDLITRLEEQQSEELQHKGWCDTELAENEHVRTTRTAAVENLRSKIDEHTASIAKLAAEVTELTNEVAELDGSVAKETAMRQTEKAENEAAIQDSKDAQTAIDRALVVLKDFYATAATATALVQRKVKQNPTAPDVFSDEPYRGMSGESGGVIGLLEVIRSDFARLQSDTEASEASQSKAHNTLMTESAVLKTQKNGDISHKSSLKQTEEQQLSEAQTNLASEERELDAANKYYDKLKPSCLDAGMSYEERDARRKEEIESLEEALRILNGEDIAFLQQQS
jgi:hypothetical protein